MTDTPETTERPVYTRAQVSDALNGAVDLLYTNPDNELPALFMLNATLVLIDDPDADLDDIIDSQWAAEDRESIRDGLDSLGYIH